MAGLASICSVRACFTPPDGQTAIRARPRITKSAGEPIYNRRLHGGLWWRGPACGRRERRRFAAWGWPFGRAAPGLRPAREGAGGFAAAGGGGLRPGGAAAFGPGGG